MRRTSPFLALFVFVVVLVYILQAFLAAPLLKRGLRYAVHEAKARYGLQVHYEDITISPFSLSLSLRDVSLVAPDESLLLSAKILGANFSWWALIMGSMPLSELYLQGGQLNLYFQNGHLNGLDFGLFQHEESKKPLAHVLSRVHVEDLALRIFHEEKAIEIQNIELELYGKKKKMHAALLVEGATYNDATIQQELTRLSIAAYVARQNIFSPDRIFIEHLAASFPEGDAWLKAVMDLDVPTQKAFLLDAQVEADSSLQRILQRFELPLVIAGDLGLKGHLQLSAHKEDFLFKGVLDTRHIEVGGRLFDSFGGQIAINHRAIFLEDTVVDLGAVPVSLRGQIALDKALSYQIEVDAQRFSLYELLYSLDVRNSWTELLIDTHVKGEGEFIPSFFFQGHSKGKAYDLVVAQGPASPYFHSVPILRTKEAVDFEMGLFVDTKAFRFIDAHLKDSVSDGHAECALYFDAQKGMELDTNFKQIDFRSVHNSIAGFHFEGRGQAKGSIEGPYQDLTIDIPADFSQLIFENAHLGEVNTEVYYKTYQLSFLESKLKKGVSSLFGNLIFDFSDNVHMQLETKGKGLLASDMRGILQVYSQIPLEGFVDAEAVLQGDLGGDNAYQMTGYAKIDVKKGSRLYERDFAANVSVLFDEGNISLEECLLKSDGLQLTAKAEYHASQFQLSDMQLTKDAFRLGLRENVTADLQEKDLSFTPIYLETPQGSLLQGEIHVGRQGPFLNLIAHGPLEELRAVWPELAFMAGTYDMVLELDSKHMKVQRFVLKHEEGFLSVEGHLKLHNFLPQYYALKAYLDKWPLEIPLWAKAFVSGELFLQGDPELPVVKGNLALSKGRVFKELSMNTGNVFASTSSFSLGAWSFPLIFDVHVDIDKSLRVSNHYLRSDWRGGLDIKGTLQHPIVLGSLWLLNGEVFLLKNRYRLLKGRLDFSEENAFVPQIDVEAETKVRDYDVSVRLEGAANAPLVSVQSRPFLSEAEIGSLLSLGFTSKEVQSDTKAMQAASWQVLGFYTGIGERIKRIVPRTLREEGRTFLDDVQLTSMFSEHDASVLPALMLSFDIASNMKLRLQSTLLHNSQDALEQRADMDIALGRKWRLRFSWSSEGESSLGDAGADVWYAWEF